jgi:Tfp pilus assembly protein PilP
MAAVVSKDKSYALILAPDTKRYIVKKGDAIGTREGKITKIDISGITVREVERDARGEILSTPETELRLPEKER